LLYVILSDYNCLFYRFFKVNILALEKCLNLETFLKRDNLLDLDELDLFAELNILKKIID